jgi:hypothetical protein
VKVYIAGRISGVKNYGVPFAKAANKFRAQGHIVFDPAHANQEGRPLTSIMAYLLPQLCSCDTIALLPGWWLSGGARIEWILARYLGHRIIYL